MQDPRSKDNLRTTGIARGLTVDSAFTAESLYGTQREPTYSGALSFLRRRYSRDLTGVDVAVTGIPLDTATSNRPGARFGPRAVREASAQLAWNRPYGWDFDPLDHLAVVDYGDCHWDYGRQEQVPAAIEEHIGRIADAGASPLSIGGDHFLTFPILRAMAKRRGKLSLLHFDAHSDTWGDTVGSGRVDHGTMFFHATREGLVEPSRSVQIGLRTYNPDTLGFHVLDAPWVHRNGAKAVIEQARSILGDSEVYLTFDIDCLDPGFAPGTGTPVCGGLSTAMALEILRGLRGIAIVGMDVVEVAPAYDVSEITALAGATIAHEALGLYACRPGARKGGEGADGERRNEG
ncbi:agmatinase [Sorangium cellulosum]|uniref:Agmatinase n=1 Tax=Sorangium cellulosum TaxID=56 RepID=A0A2L0FBW8_SORCE|nr:agmatinase [Sorangium cellulosum]AUX49021.1 agmatinase [Sorangium cellulosum]